MMTHAAIRRALAIYIITLCGAIMVEQPAI
jgi:hypothetical protein